MDQHRHTFRNIDRDLVREARIHAIETGQSLGEVINAALGWYLYELDTAQDDTDMADAASWS